MNNVWQPCSDIKFHVVTVHLEVLFVQDEFKEGYVQKKGICRAEQAAQLCLEIER